MWLNLLRDSAAVNLVVLVSALGVQALTTRHRPAVSASWFALMVAMSVTELAFLPSVLITRNDELRNALSCNIFLNIWGVGGSGVVLWVALSRWLTMRGQLGLAAAMASLAATVVTIGLLEPEYVGCIGSSVVMSAPAYWWLITITHLLSSAVASLVCMRDFRRGPGLLIRLSIFLLILAFSASVLYWILVAACFLVHKHGPLAVADSFAYPLIVFGLAGASALPVVDWLRWWYVHTRQWRELGRRVNLRGMDPSRRNSILSKRIRRPDVIVHRLRIEFIDRHSDTEQNARL